MGTAAQQEGPAPACPSVPISPPEPRHAALGDPLSRFITYQLAVEFYRSVYDRLSLCSSLGLVNLYLLVILTLSLSFPLFLLVMLSLHLSLLLFLPLNNKQTGSVRGAQILKLLQLAQLGRQHAR